MASALHEDPRFYAEIHPTFGQAMKYSVQRVFIMRNDDGREVVAWSRLGGPLLAEGLANVYWPDRNRTVGDTLFGTAWIWQAGGWKYAARILAGVVTENQPHARARRRAQQTILEKG